MDEKSRSVGISPSQGLPDATNVPLPSTDAPTKPVLVTDTPQEQYTQGNMHGMAPGNVQQQVMYVPLKYSPQPS